MRRKLILFDIDGTLYDNNKKEIPLSTIKALKTLKEKGHELAIATGRSYRMIKNLTEIEDLIDNYLLINGQLIICHQEVIHSCPVEVEIITKLIDSFLVMGVKYGMQSADGEALCPSAEDISLLFKEYGINVPVASNKYHLENIVYQVWCFASPEQISILEKKHPEFDFLAWGSFGYDVIIKGKSKGKSLPILAKHCQIAIEDTIAFGDGKNDIELLKAAGLGIAMGNAALEVKEASDYVTTRVDEDGIYQALNYWKLI